LGRDRSLKKGGGKTSQGSCGAIGETLKKKNIIRRPQEEREKNRFAQKKKDQDHQNHVGSRRKKTEHQVVGGRKTLVRRRRKKKRQEQNRTLVVLVGKRGDKVGPKNGSVLSLNNKGGTGRKATLRKRPTCGKVSGMNRDGGGGFLSRLAKGRGPPTNVLQEDEAKGG